MTLGMHVASVEALLRLRAAVQTFILAADKSLCEASIEVDRTADWIAHDQQSHWSGEAKRRHDAVVQAKEEVRRAQWTIGDHKPGAIEQKQALKKAEARLAEAQEKLKNISRWKREFAQAANEYKGQVQHLASALDADLPRAVAMLDRALGNLESYLSVQPEASDLDDIPGLREDELRSMAQPLAPRKRDLEAPDERSRLIQRLRERAAGVDRANIALDRGLSSAAAVADAPAGAVERPEGIEPRPCRPGDLVTLEAGALEAADDLFMCRLDGVARGDSGWHIGLIGAGEPEDGSSGASFIATTASRLLLLRPDWRDVLSCPPGDLILIRRGKLERIPAAGASTEEEENSP